MKVSFSSIYLFIFYLPFFFFVLHELDLCKGFLLPQAKVLFSCNIYIYIYIYFGAEQELKSLILELHVDFVSTWNLSI